MEDLATDRIYRLMITQRIRHGMHSAADVTRFFDEELAKLLAERAADDAAQADRLPRSAAAERSDDRAGLP